jgi:hypothetical protein
MTCKTRFRIGGRAYILITVISLRPNLGPHPIFSVLRVPDTFCLSIRRLNHEAFYIHLVSKLSTGRPESSSILEYYAMSIGKYCRFEGVNFVCADELAVEDVMQ